MHSAISSWNSLSGDNNDVGGSNVANVTEVNDNFQCAAGAYCQVPFVNYAGSCHW
jgi:hypothetical protein